MDAEVQEIMKVGDPPVIRACATPPIMIERLFVDISHTSAVSFLIEHHPDSIVVFDAEWHFLYANLQWERQTGLSRENTKGRLLWDYAPSLVGSELEVAYRKCMKNQQSCYFTCVHPLTNKYTMTWAYPSTNGFCLQLRDLSDVQEIQRWNEELELRVEQRTHDLKKAQEFNARVIKDSVDGIVGFDTNLEIFAFNPTMERLTGIPRANVTGKSILVLFPDHKHNDILDIIQRVFKGETIIFRGENYLTPSTQLPEDESLGGPDYERYYVPLIDDIDGSVIGAVISYKNVAQQNQTRIELAKARDEALSLARAKSEFLANMSHELRTPLNAIIGMTDLLKESHLDTQQQEYFDIVQSSAVSLLAIVNQVLDFSKYEVGKMPLMEEDFVLAGVVNNTAVSFCREAERKGLLYEWRFFDGLDRYTVNGDPVRLRQILVNLVNNAIKFTARGFVRVIVSKVDDPVTNGTGEGEVTGMGSEMEGKSSSVVWVGITVEDSGLGMSENTLKALFAPFTQADASTTREYGGTGLGLAIVKQIVECMGGSVSVSSKVDVGTVFVVRVPYKIIDIQEQKDGNGSNETRIEDRSRSYTTPPTSQNTPTLNGYRASPTYSDAYLSPYLHTQLSSIRVGSPSPNLLGSPNVFGNFFPSPSHTSPHLYLHPHSHAHSPTPQPTSHHYLHPHTHSPSPTSYLYPSHTQVSPLMHTHTLLPPPHTLLPSVPSEFMNLESDTHPLMSHLPPTQLHVCHNWGRKRSKSGSGESDSDSSESVMQRPKWDTHKTPTPRRRSVDRVYETPEQERCHVLVVEDNEVNKKVLTLLLKRLKTTVEVCSNGREAVDLLSAAPNAFDLVLMDVQMPVMDGYTAAVEIRKNARLSHIPIIAMTANAMPGDRERCIEAGMDDYIAKPINMKVLSPILEQWGKKILIPS